MGLDFFLQAYRLLQHGKKSILSRKTYLVGWSLEYGVRLVVDGEIIEGWKYVVTFNESNNINNNKNIFFNYKNLIKSY